MYWLESLLYGLFTGFSEYVPVSSRAHGSVLRYLFGVDSADPIQNIVVRFSVIVALLVCCRQMIFKLLYDVRLSQRYRRTKSARGTMRSTYDVRLLRAALIPMFVGLLLYGFGDRFESQNLMLALFLTVNGIILYITDHVRQGNKDARLMSGLDAIGIGLSSAAVALPGMSRFGMNAVFSVFRGADKQNAVNWALLLSIPALLFLNIFDLFTIFTGNSVTAFGIVSYLFTAVGAFVGAYFGILLVRFLAVCAGFSGYAYYCWGLAMFTFVLYLIV